MNCQKLNFYVLVMRSRYDKELKLLTWGEQKHEISLLTIIALHHH